MEFEANMISIEAVRKIFNDTLDNCIEHMKESMPVPVPKSAVEKFFEFHEGHYAHSLYKKQFDTARAEWEAMVKKQAKLEAAVDRLLNARAEHAVGETHFNALREARGKKWGI